ncbi:hypothetical protein [Alloalcanivorax sp.]|uniref:hypothetical protein n=1 Tax=Alloalcanivorax sp. TaxID=3020835 RepID=UPI0035160E2D
MGVHQALALERLHPAQAGQEQRIIAVLAQREETFQMILQLLPAFMTDPPAGDDSRKRGRCLMAGELWERARSHRPAPTSR